MIGITEISAVVAAVGVLVGVVYYILDMRNQSKMRETDMVMRIYAVFESIEFQKAYVKLMDEELENYADFRKKHGADEVRIAMNSVGLFFEGVGVLAKRKLISMDLVDDLLGSNILWTWEKVRDSTLENRKVTNQPEILEWFEYLYNEMKKREQTPKQS